MNNQFIAQNFWREIETKISKKKNPRTYVYTLKWLDEDHCIAVYLESVHNISWLTQ